MFKIGDKVRGAVIDDATGEWVEVVGEFVTRTDDPEEYIQDIIIRTADGQTVYIDEQVAHLDEESKA